MPIARELKVPLTPRRAWSSLEDTRAGLRAGAAFGVVATLVRIVYWMQPHPTEAFPPLGIALIQVAFPIAAGAISGAAVGALWPWRRYRASALMLGLASASLFAAGVTAGWTYPAPWTVDLVVQAFAAAAIAGIGLGSSLYDDNQPVTPEEVRQEMMRVGPHHALFADRVPAWETCPCCGYQTFTAHEAIRHCVLCEWEDGVEPSELSLADARANFARYTSIYDPHHLPPWRSAPPSAREVTVRRELIRTFDEMEHERRPAELNRLWEGAQRALGELSAISFQHAESEDGGRLDG